MKDNNNEHPNFQQFGEKWGGYTQSGTLSAEQLQSEVEEIINNNELESKSELVKQKGDNLKNDKDWWKNY